MSVTGDPPENDGGSPAKVRENFEVEAYFLEDDGRIPNHPRYPLLLYRGALVLSGGDPARSVERTFRYNNWDNNWRDGIFPYHHYHSTTHEVLGLARGEVEVQFGGEGGVNAALRAGDVAILPAGTGHKNLGSGPDLLVVGGYPAGQSWDLLRGEPEERPQALQNIRGVPRPDTDPVLGSRGPLLERWSPRSAE